MISDIKLLGYVATTLFFFLALMLMLTLRLARRVQGTRLWLWGTLVVAVGFALHTLQDSIQPFLGLLLSNLMIIGGATVSAMGTFEYRYRRSASLGWCFISMALLTLAFVYLVYIEPSAVARIALLTGSASAVCVWHVWTILAGSAVRRNAPGVQNSRFSLPHAIMTLGLLILAIALALRAFYALNGLGAPVASVDSSRMFFAFYTSGLTGRVLILSGMVLVLIDELDFELRALALRDPLTGLLNRRGLNETIASQSLAHCSLLMLDLDQFKAINDDLGHREGDRVIALFARCAQANLPADAVLARLGGEEFCALLPRTDKDEAMAIADALRVAFHLQTLTLAHGRPHTVSVGVASSRSPAATLSRLMEHADQALYHAKRNGRNRIEVAQRVAS